MKRLFHSAIVACLLSLAGCHHEQPNYTAPLAPNMLALCKIPPEAYPKFDPDPADLAQVHTAILHSLDYLAKHSSEHYYPYADISHDRAVATLKALDQLITSPSASPDSIDEQIRQDFEVYQSVGAPGLDGKWTGQVRFTGYFTPIYNASLTRGGPFQWPLYKRPADLVSDPITGQVQGRRTANGTLVPYYTRAQIEGGVLNGQELCWLTSRWEAYVVTVQGSGRLRMPDGSIYEIGFAGDNGYPYQSAGEQMVADGVIPEDQISLKTMGDYFASHPEDMNKYLSSNPRTVFFAERPGGPFGSLNEPVTPLATIATDKSDRDIYPRAMAAFLTVTLPTPDGQTRPYRGFMLDQDTGGAIRASGRCDIYMGIGDAAANLAGRELTEGQLYYIAIKPELVGNYVKTGGK
jgi:membrane-bound lytic murein transglycosylase A